MKILLFLTLQCCLALSVVAQKKDSVVYSRKGRSGLGGTVAYYFWREDSLGKIVPNSFERPFRRNEIVVFNAFIPQKEKLNQARLVHAVSEMSHANRTKEKRFFDADPPVHGPNKLLVPMRKRKADAMTTVHFRYKEGHWQSFTRKNVIYLNVFADSSKKYSHANDSVILSHFNIKKKARGHYFVKTFWNGKREIIDQQVYAYDGTNVSSYFLNEQSIKPQRILIFSNGYRGPRRNKDASDNLITKKDRYWYWMKLDRHFLQRMQPDDYYYIDGSHQISTSNHRTKTQFGVSYSRIKALRKKEKNAHDYHLLNRTPNDSGFQARKTAGIVAAKAYLALRCNLPTCEESKDTIDLICHSMGYAYALGFLEALQHKVVFGRMYIIAPENACSDGMDWSLFDEVWQYGSNLDQENPDPVWEQDGIAPQCEVKNLSTAKKGGRVFFPEDYRKKNFIDSHLLKQYHWIIKKIKPGEPGYVH